MNTFLEAPGCTSFEDEVEISRPRLAWQSFVLPLAVVGVGAFLLLHHAEVRTWIDSLRTLTQAQGAWGAVIFTLIYSVAVVCFVPGALMTPVAVALYGPWLAVVMVSAGGSLGATMAFLISRYCLRDWVAHRFQNSSRFRWLDEHTARRGALFVAVARIVPTMPGNVLHYAFGITRVPFGVYLFWSWLGSLDGLILFVTGCDVFMRITTLQPIPPAQVLILIGLLTIKVLLLRWAAHQAGFDVRRRRFKDDTVGRIAATAVKGVRPAG